MKKEDLFEAIGNIDEYYVKESEKKQSPVIRPFSIGKTLVSAAAIILIFGVAIILPRLIRPDGINPVDTGKPTDTTDTTLDTPIEYEHPTDEEIIAAYEAACEAASWFRASSLGSICGDKSDHVLIDGQPYWRVTRFETNDEFRAYLLSLFSDKLAAEFVNGSSDYVVQDGKLYSAPIPFGAAPPWNDSVRISDISHEDENRISLLVTYDIYDYADRNAIAPTGQVIGTEMLLFLYEKIDGKWVFTRFPMLDSMEIYEKYTGTVDNDLTDGNYIFLTSGVNIPLPGEYMNEGYLNIVTGNRNGALITLYCSPQYLSSGRGEILRLYRYTKSEYETNVLQNPVGNVYSLATDGEYYYAMGIPTDLQVDPTDAEGASKYEELAEGCRTAIRENFAAVNGFDSVHFDYSSNIFTFDVDGVRMPIPAEFINERYISIITGQNVDESLFVIYHSPEHDKSGYGEILRVHRYSAGEYERNFLEGNLYTGGAFALATDGESYYVMSVPTDVQGDPTDAVAFKEYGEVAEACRAAIREHFAEANGFESIDSREFYDRKYTYDGEHYFVRFYPYGKGTNSYYTLVLSQPAKQGEGGIWCVERWLDHHVEEISSLGHIHLTFPDSGDLSAVEYYAKLQREFEGGKHSKLASPMSAAKAWAAEMFSNSHIGYFETSDEQDMPEGEWIY